MEVNEELVRQNGNQAAAVMADYAAQGGGGGSAPDTISVIPVEGPMFSMNDDYFLPEVVTLGVDITPELARAYSTEAEADAAEAAILSKLSSVKTAYLYPAEYAVYTQSDSDGQLNISVRKYVLGKAKSTPKVFRNVEWSCMKTTGGPYITLSVMGFSGGAAACNIAARPTYNDTDFDWTDIRVYLDIVDVHTPATVLPITINTDLLEYNEYHMAEIKGEVFGLTAKIVSDMKDGLVPLPRIAVTGSLGVGETAVLSKLAFVTEGYSCLRAAYCESDYREQSMEYYVVEIIVTPQSGSPFVGTRVYFSSE